MLTEREATLNEALENVGESLDIPASKYRQAVARYEAVGRWIEDGEYDGSATEPEVIPQGSFRLGTVVRPIKDGKEADYDIDLVCSLGMEKDATAPGDLKSMVGDRLKENGTYAPMLDEEGRRCWTLQYAEQDGVGFHMDICPVVPEADPWIGGLIANGVPWQYAQHAVAITDKNKESGRYSWSPSNPKGYAEWFDHINRTARTEVTTQQKQALFERHGAIYASVDAVPDALVRTPLQRVIQILKRHRDMRFLGHKWEEDKPISMVVTTLAARAYQDETDVYSAVMSIIGKLERHAWLLKPAGAPTEGLDRQLIDRHDGRWYMPNPVNPAENFAERWNDRGSDKALAFFQWVSWVKQDLQDALGARDAADLRLVLVPSFGKRVVEAAIPPRRTAGPTPSRYARVTISNPSKPWGSDVC